MEHHFRPAAPSDLNFLFALYPTTMRDVVEQTWGWDDACQRADFAKRFAESVVSVIEVEGHAAGTVWLHDLGVSEEAIAAERRSMEKIAVARTTDRHVLGSVNEFVHAIRFALEDQSDKSLHELSLWLAHTPILPLKDFPDRMTRRLIQVRMLQ